MSLQIDQNLNGPLEILLTAKDSSKSELKLRRFQTNGVLMLSKTLALVMCLSISTFASITYAGEGAGSGGGGDVRCYEYSNLMGQIVKSLAVAGQEEIDRINPLIRVDKLIDIKQKLKCLPVTRLDRQARSYPEDTRTDLLVTEWKKLEYIEKIKLTSHELSVLAGYEADGEYFVSVDIVKIAIENSRDLKNQMSADNVKNNPDGSVTFHYPFTMIDGKKIYFGNEYRKEVKFFLFVPVEFSDSIFTHGDHTHPKSVCNFFGYKESLSFKESKSKTNEKTYVSLNNEGSVIGSSNKDSFGFGTMIIASGMDYSVIYNFQTLTCK